MNTKIQEGFGRLVECREQLVRSTSILTEIAERTGNHDLTRVVEIQRAQLRAIDESLHVLSDGLTAVTA